MQNTQVERPAHGHHKVAAAIFVGALILGAAMIMSADLMKTERYEFHPGADPGKYIIYDRNTGRATVADFDAKNPITSLAD